MSDMENTPKHILYIEDEAFFATTMSRLLAGAGYATDIAEDGEKGLAMAKSTKPDLILLDLVLPKIDGKEVLRQLKADPQTKNIPVIVLSNLSAEQDQREAAALGAVGFFVKAMTLPSAIVETITTRLSA